MSRWAATSTTLLARARGRVDDAERVEVEDGVVQRHRHLVLGLEAHRGGELLAVGDGRQLERAQDGALVGDADAHPLAQPAVAEQLAQGLASAASSSTSPSRTVSAGSGRAAARSATIEPLTRACTAATKPGWMSRPTRFAPERRPRLRLSDGEVEARSRAESLRLGSAGCGEAAVTDRPHGAYRRASRRAL